MKSALRLPFLAPLSLLAAAFAAQLMTSYGSIDKSPDVFFRPAPAQPAEKLPEALYPEGSLFPFSFYSVGGGPRAATKEALDLPEEALQSLFEDYKNSGFRIIGPQYGLNTRSVDDAAAHQFKVIYSVGLGKKEFRAMDPEALPMEEIAKKIREEVKAVGDNRAIVAWDLRPEELRPWRKHEHDYLVLASRTIREADPLKRPVFQYCPGHYGSEALAQVAPYVDLLGKGMYTNYSSQKKSRIWCKWSIEQEVEAIKKSGSKAIPIALPEMFRQPEPSETALIPDWVRHDVYLSLVSGAKGVLVFSLRQRADFPAWQAYFDAYKSVGSELLKGDKLGQLFLFGEKRDDVAVEIIKGPQTVEMTYPSANVTSPVRYPSINWIDLAHGPNRYLIAVNSANESCEAIISGFPYDAVKAEPLFENRPAFDIGEGEFQVGFKPLEVKAYRFTRK